MDRSRVDKKKTLLGENEEEDEPQRFRNVYISGGLAKKRFTCAKRPLTTATSADISISQ